MSIGVMFFACAFLLFGSIECFSGYKLSKAIPEIKGFFIGAITGVLIGYFSGSTVGGIVLVFLLGCLFAVLSAVSYFAGKFVVSAFLTFIMCLLLFDSVLIGCIAALLAGVVSLFLAKHTVICLSAFSGMGIVLASTFFLMDAQMSMNIVLTVALWVPITVVGIVCQYITNPKEVEPNSGNILSPAAKVTPASFDPEKYPGMQVAYRIFCINCGAKLFNKKNCPHCGFSIDQGEKEF